MSELNIDTSKWWGGYRIRGIGTPSASSDAATKGYVDAQAGGGGCYVSYSGSCRSGFTNHGSAGSWGSCDHQMNQEIFRPPGGGCFSGWTSRTIGAAYVCCK